MCLFFLSDYIGLGKIPKQLVDVNIASDYSKLGKMLDLCKGEERQQIIEDTTEKDLVSMLYYLGYLTISGEFLGKTELKIPNKVMKEIYV